MQFANPPDDTEDAEHSSAQRAEAASRCTCVSVAASLVLTTPPIAAATVGVMVAKMGWASSRDAFHELTIHVSPWRRLDLDHSRVVPRPANQSLS